MRLFLSLAFTLTPTLVFATLIPETSSPERTLATFALTCQTSVSMAKVWADTQGLHLHIENLAGFEDFPIYSGVVTPLTLPHVERAARDLAGFGQVVEMTWKIEQCRIDPSRPFLIGCGGAGQITSPPGSELLATNMETSVENEESLDVKSDQVNLNIGLNSGASSDFTHFFLTFPFAKDHCRTN